MYLVNEIQQTVCICVQVYTYIKYIFLVRNIDKGDFMSYFQENCWQNIKLQGSQH